MITKENHKELSYAIANTFETALLNGEAQWNDINVSSPIPGHPDCGIVIRGDKTERGEKGFSVSLRQNFNEDTLGHKSEVFCAFALLDETYSDLMSTIDKVLDYFEQSLQMQAVPIHTSSAFEPLSKEIMQPLLDALNAGDFELAAQLTPAKYRLCGYQEFTEEHIHEQYGHGWAGQFETTVVAPGRYPVFAQDFAYHEANKLYMNHLKSYGGVYLYYAGMCTADSCDRKPDAYPFPNTVWEAPYAFSIASDVLAGNSSVHLVPPFKAELVHFQYDGEDHTTYHIVDESLPGYMKQNPSTLRNTSGFLRKSIGLSEKAHHLYKRFLREYSRSLVFYSGSIPLNVLSRDDNYTPEAVKELVDKKKIQLRNCDGAAYELTAAERLDLFYTDQINSKDREPFKWKAEYDACLKEAAKQAPLASKIEAASLRAGAGKASDAPSKGPDR